MPKVNFFAVEDKSFNFKVKHETRTTEEMTVNIEPINTPLITLNREAK
jgi:hypothetical protein